MLECSLAIELQRRERARVADACADEGSVCQFSRSTRRRSELGQKVRTVLKDGVLLRLGFPRRNLQDVANLPRVKSANISTSSELAQAV